MDKIRHKQTFYVDKVISGGVYFKYNYVKKGVNKMSSKRRRVIKQRTPMTLLESKASRVNMLLRELKRAGIKDGTWASKKLYDRLSGGKVNVMNKKLNKVVLGKQKLNKTQKKMIDKALTNFLASETSTPKGIENVRQRSIKSLQMTLSDYDNMLSYDEAEAYFNMFADSDFSSIAEKLGASETWIMIDDAKEMNDDETTFLARMNTIMDINDEDVKEKLIRIFEKYVV